MNGLLLSLFIHKSKRAMATIYKSIALHFDIGVVQTDIPEANFGIHRIVCTIIVMMLLKCGLCALLKFMAAIKIKEQNKNV